VVPRCCKTIQRNVFKSGSVDIAKVDQDGNFIHVERTGTTPAAVAGGIMYSSSAFYVGIE
jgi:hypothetical protein